MMTVVLKTKGSGSGHKETYTCLFFLSVALAVLPDLEEVLDISNCKVVSNEGS